jgi:hypothetical protein
MMIFETDNTDVLALHASMAAQDREDAFHKLSAELPDDVLAIVSKDAVQTVDFRRQVDEVIQQVLNDLRRRAKEISFVLFDRRWYVFVNKSRNDMEHTIDIAISSAGMHCRWDASNSFEFNDWDTVWSYDDAGAWVTSSEVSIDVKSSMSGPMVRIMAAIVRWWGLGHLIPETRLRRPGTKLSKCFGSFL